MPIDGSRTRESTFGCLARTDAFFRCRRDWLGRGDEAERVREGGEVSALELLHREKHLAYVGREFVRITIDCRENFGDPQEYIDLLVPPSESAAVPAWEHVSLPTCKCDEKPTEWRKFYTLLTVCDECGCVIGWEDNPPPTGEPSREALMDLWKLANSLWSPTSIRAREALDRCARESKPPEGE